MSKADRNMRIYEMRKDGKTYREIADAFSISIARAQQVYRRMQHSIEGCNSNGTALIDGAFVPYCTYCGKELP